MRKLYLHLIILYGVTLLLTACSSGPRYHITVLQCSAGNWRFQLNNELMAAQHLFEEDVEVEILNCFDRSGQTGNKDFNGSFSIPSMQAPLCVTGNSVTLDIFVDQSSVEVFTQDGTMAMTNLVFPSGIYNQLSVEGAAAECQVRQLKRIWK